MKEKDNVDYMVDVIMFAMYEDEEMCERKLGKIIRECLNEGTNHLKGATAMKKLACSKL